MASSEETSIAFMVSISIYVGWFGIFYAVIGAITGYHLYHYKKDIADQGIHSPISQARRTFEKVVRKYPRKF
jgi:hypothetical protein